MNYRPLNNRVLLKPEEKPQETASGLLLAEKVVEKPILGLVVVGNDKVAKGERVHFSKFGYDEVTLEGELYYVVSDYNIIGIL